MLGRLLTKAVSALGYWQSGPAKLTDPVLGTWMGGGTRTHAGKSVTVDSALQISTVWACVRLIAETIATLPCNVYETGPNGRRLARSHPLYALLHDSPNADHTATEFWELVAASLLLHGNAYVQLERVLGRVVALTWLIPARVALRRGDDGAVLYTYSDPAGGPRDLAEDDVLHIRGFSLDGCTGLSPIAQAAHSIGLAMAAEESAGRIFANGMRIGGYISAPGTFTVQQRPLAEDLLKRFQGSVNAGRTPILEAGWKYESLTMPPQQAELLATRGFGVEELCRWYRVPPHMVGHLSGSTSWGTGIEQQAIGFVTLTLRPWLKRIETAAKRRLLAPGERGRIEIEFNVAGLLRGDSAARSAYYTAMVSNGIYSRDEVRDLENLPRRGGIADALTIQSQNIPIDLAGAQPVPMMAALGATPQESTP